MEVNVEVSVAWMHRTETIIASKPRHIYARERSKRAIARRDNECV
jgi:hypothetical protein